MSSADVILTLMTGVLSPVNIDSLIIIEPLVNIVSQGIDKPSSGISNISPGTNSVEFISTGAIISLFSFFLYTLTGHE